MAGQFIDGPAPGATGQFIDAPAPDAHPGAVLPGGGFGSGGFGAVIKQVGKGAKKVEKNVGRAIEQGHNDPFGSVMNVLGAPQRGLQSLETNNETNEGKRLGSAWAAMLNPKTGKGLTQKVKDQTGISGLEAGPLAGNDLGHKFARGAVDTGMDIVNDPLTFLPVGKIARLAGKIPGVAEAAGAAAKAAKDSPVGKTLNPEEYLRGLTPAARAKYEVITNRSMQAVHKQKEAEDAIVRAHASEIRKGIMPPEVARLFTTSSQKPGVQSMSAWQEHFLDPRTGKSTFGKGTRPQDVISALYRNRAPVFTGSEAKRTGALGGLKDQGFFNDAGHVPSGMYDTADPEEIKKIQDRLRLNVQPKAESDNLLLKAARAATHRGNQAFLSIPVPHGGNLVNLSYNRYGLPTTLKGIGRAARVATGTVGNGKLAKNIDELEDLGANSQYGKIYDELGLTGSNLKGPGVLGKVAGGINNVTQAVAPIANKVIIPAERLSNYAQDKFLNPLETGLRSAALDAERAGGTTGPAAARNIHAAFGTDAPNRLTESGQKMGEGFAKFHLQTALWSVLRALATNPGRVVAPLKADRDMNNQVNPHGPKYHLSIPTMSTARAIADPLHYWPAAVGPIGQLGSAYSSLTEAQKGKLLTAIGDTVSRYMPLSEAAPVLSGKKRGPAGEKAVNDLIPLLLGGYFQKAKP
jgi:hypothetical protein